MSVTCCCLVPKMEDKLIIAVCGHPELYDVTSPHYKLRTKKDLPWRKVSEEVGLPEEICRRKWKGLRDTYLKEKKKERERKSGSAGTGGKRWKYSAVLSFLDPFVTPKETSGNMRVGVEEEDRTAEYTQDEGPVEDQGSNAAAAEPSDVDMGDMPDHSCDSIHSNPTTQSEEED
ncbi:transcription factor Adf-1-like [Epinephelus fuscoguttatus]|uniref:transcription factor Adf-1-like n=1 Tax=Epinephelus fuscoguttatus TaxID=293821 RepID=UPI0020D14721|nr:transcription factor Adf-1-like [Epinephelus fuscoguttatus]